LKDKMDNFVCVVPRRTCEVVLDSLFHDCGAEPHLLVISRNGCLDSFFAGHSLTPAIRRKSERSQHSYNPIRWDRCLSTELFDIDVDSPIGADADIASAAQG
jgi:hypothetical protein